MDGEFNKPSSSKEPQACGVNSRFTCAQEDMQMNSTKCQEQDNNEDYSLSSDDSEIILWDDINTNQKANNAGVYEVDVKNADISVNPNYLREQVDGSVSEGLKKVLFRNHFMEPITFLLLLHDFRMELKLSKLIEDYGGLVYGSVNEIDGFTAVLVKDESIHWPYSGPVFKVSYIAACLKAKQIIDIAPFFKASVKPKFTKYFDFMNIIYFKKQTWDGVPDTSGASVKMCSKSANESQSCENDSDSDVPLIVEEIQKKSSVVKKSINKHSRTPYSIREDENIIKYIIKKNGYDNLRGTLFWRQMEKRDVCPKRTWQSMKEHFRKKIVLTLDSFKFLSDDEKRLLQSSCL